LRPGPSRLIAIATACVSGEYRPRRAASQPKMGKRVPKVADISFAFSSVQISPQSTTGPIICCKSMDVRISGPLEAAEEPLELAEEPLEAAEELPELAEEPPEAAEELGRA